MFELRATFAELNRRLTSQTSSSDVATRRGISIEERDKLAAAIDLHPEAVRVRARDLLTLPDAGDIAGRRAATERATIEAARTRTVEREAYLEKENARDGSVYKGAVDLAHVGASGHSQGGRGAIMAGRPMGMPRDQQLMPAFGNQFSEPELEVLIGYVRSLSNPKVGPEQLTPEAVRERSGE